jgi:hypothetical protein
MFFIQKIFLVIILGMLTLFVYFVAVPYIQNFQANTLPKQISTEISSNQKKPILASLGTATIVVNLAVTNFEKEKGLGGSFFLSDNNGMLFVYEREGYPAIWMKNMIFPIDIIWLNSDFRIVDVEKNVSPLTYPTAFSPDLPAQYVLEVNAGFFDLHNIQIGDTLKLVESEDNSV